MVKFEHRHPWIVWNGKTTCVRCKVRKNENNRFSRCSGKQDVATGEESILKSIEQALRKRLTKIAYKKGLEFPPDPS